MKYTTYLIFLCLALSACSVTDTKAVSDDLKLLANTSSAACNKKPDPSLTQFIVGYGSLMQKASRLRTAPNAETAYAVELKGYRRGWFTKGSSTGFSTTYLGAVTDPSAHINAVIFAVSPEELSALDRRESGYCRSAIEPGQLIVQGKAEKLPGAQFWIYSNNASSIALPTQEMPLVQSYIDIFLSGCMELEEQYTLKDFARECINTTTDWSDHWVNDRIYPRRPFIYQPRASQIDQLLRETLPALFRKITIE